ncbi:hypothetical protein [Streptococcus suis]|uniref:hypothetical protein n=1 Tax=Streptococcus suis TaxID=1307 RepID=UPI00062CDD09|nr:hypothetical protein [Streptococcus suis]AKH10966.1 hypothetical protein HAS68_0399 [Streptococcus suis 05HAS68]
MVENLLGIPCGHNPVVLGSVVDGNTKIFGEIVTVFSGDIIFGNLKKLDVYTEGEILKLSDLYDKYKDYISPNDSYMSLSLMAYLELFTIADIPDVGYGIYLQKPQVMPDTQKNHCGNSGLQN